MPTYTFRNKKTNKEWTEICSLSDREETLKDPDIEQMVVSAPGIGDPIRLGRQKPAKEFRNLLKKIHKGAGKESKINTW